MDSKLDCEAYCVLHMTSHRPPTAAMDVTLHPRDFHPKRQNSLELEITGHQLSEQAKQAQITLERIRQKIWANILTARKILVISFQYMTSSSSSPLPTHFGASQGKAV